MVKLVLAIALPSDATPETIAAAVRQEAPNVAAALESAGHIADLYSPGVAGGDAWAAQLVPVPLV